MTYECMSRKTMLINIPDPFAQAALTQMMFQNRHKTNPTRHFGSYASIYPFICCIIMKVPSYCMDNIKAQVNENGFFMSKVKESIPNSDANATYCVLCK